MTAKDVAFDVYKTYFLAGQGQYMSALFIMLALAMEVIMKTAQQSMITGFFHISTDAIYDLLENPIVWFVLLPGLHRFQLLVVVRMVNTFYFIC